MGRGGDPVLKSSILFPGQGSQVPGMGKSLCEQFTAAKEIFEQADDFLKFSLTDKIFNGSEEDLKETSVTQSAVYTVNCAAWTALRSLCPELNASFAAGHSLGEYSALFAAGVYDFQAGLRLVKARGEIMAEASKTAPGAMAAVIGLDKDSLGKYCEETGAGGCCEMVNFNAPGQIVVSGTKPSVDVLLLKLQTLKGVKTVSLRVSGAFHSSLMAEASLKMAQILENADLRDPQFPVITNVDAKAESSSKEISRKLSAQIDHPVLWEESMRLLIREDTQVFIECGPGKVLSGILRKIDREQTVVNVEDADSLKKTVEKLTKSGEKAGFPLARE